MFPVAFGQTPEGKETQTRPLLMKGEKKVFLEMEKKKKKQKRKNRILCLLEGSKEESGIICNSQAIIHFLGADKSFSPCSFKLPTLEYISQRTVGQTCLDCNKYW